MEESTSEHAPILEVAWNFTVIQDGPKTGLRPPGSEAANSKIDKMRGKKGKKKGQVGMRDGDFEKMFGENIDQCIEKHVHGGVPTIVTALLGVTADGCAVKRLCEGKGKGG